MGRIATGGRGGNSGLQALNLVLQWGARDIAFVGLDLGGEHWHGRHPRPCHNPHADTFRRWREVFEAAAPQVAALGARVVNCSTVSALTCWPVMSLEEWEHDAAGALLAHADHAAGARSGDARPGEGAPAGAA